MHPDIMQHTKRLGHTPDPASEFCEGLQARASTGRSSTNGSTVSAVASANDERWDNSVIPARLFNGRFAAVPGRSKEHLRSLTTVTRSSKADDTSINLT